MAANTKKSSFLDRLSGKVSDELETNTDDIIDEDISDDELDKLLAANLTNSTESSTNTEKSNGKTKAGDKLPKFELDGMPSDESVPENDDKTTEPRKNDSQADEKTAAKETSENVLPTTPTSKLNNKDKAPTNKSPSTTEKGKTMTDTTQLEKIQSDIDELKRKVHAMSSEYFTAATDSASLISQLREFDSNASDDFTGTYNQARELRKMLIDARKLFTQVPVTLDMLEEALESDLYASKK